MHAHRNILSLGNIAMHEGRVLFAIAVVIERDDLKFSESGRQFGNRSDPYANMILAEAVALGADFRQKFLNLKRIERHYYLP
jgi:hypothetical protein